MSRQRRRGLLVFDMPVEIALGLPCPAYPAWLLGLDSAILSVGDIMPVVARSLCWRIWLEKPFLALGFEHEFDSALRRLLLVDELDDFGVEYAIESVTRCFHISF